MLNLPVAADVSLLLEVSATDSVSSKVSRYMHTSCDSFLMGAMTWLQMNLVPALTNQERKSIKYEQVHEKK